MTTTQEWRRLADTVTAAHEAARTALTAPDGRPLDAVVWLSAHLAAVDHVVRPAAERALARSDRHLLAAHRRSTGALLGELRRLERVASGDATSPAGSSALIAARVLDRLDEHAGHEEALLARTTDAVGAETAADLAGRYEAALHSAPTRPHPHVRPHGPLERLTYRVDALRDRVLDTLDARPVPTAQRKPPRPLGRWGRYFLGG